MKEYSKVALGNVLLASDAIHFANSFKFGGDDFLSACHYLIMTNSVRGFHSCCIKYANDESVSDEFLESVNLAVKVLKSEGYEVRVNEEIGEGKVDILWFEDRGVSHTRSDGNDSYLRLDGLASTVVSILKHMDSKDASIRSASEDSHNGYADLLLNALAKINIKANRGAHHTRIYLGSYDESSDKVINNVDAKRRVIGELVRRGFKVEDEKGGLFIYVEW